MDPAFEQKVEANADRIIAESMPGGDGSGALTQFFEQKRGEIEDAVFADYQKGRAMRGEAERSPQELQAEVDAQFQAYANGSVRGALIGAASGDQKATLDLDDVTGIAGAAGNVASNFATGNLLGLITSIPALINNSFIGDYFNAAIRYFFGGENKPNSFGEALAEVRLSRGVGPLAGQMGVDGQTLTNELLRDVPPPPAEQVASRVPSDVEVPEGLSGGTLDVAYNGRNGIPPEGGPSTATSGTRVQEHGLA